MAELLSSSDDESLGDEPQERAVPPLVRANEAPFKPLSDTASTGSQASQEPENELFESLFSPRKQREKKPLADSDELFPWTTSAESSQGDETKSRSGNRALGAGGKPVISARAMLLGLLSKTSKTLGTSSSTATTTSTTPTVLPIKRTLVLDDAKSEGGEEEEANSGWRKRPKQMSESERIARKYGLLPSKETQHHEKGDGVDSARSRGDTESDTTRRQRSTTAWPPPRVAERPRQPSPLSNRDAFWKSQRVENQQDDDMDTDEETSYVSPFASRKQPDGKFRDMRKRRQVPTIDKETFYTDDALRPSPVNRPRHVIASRLTAGEEEGWLSDAKEINSGDEDEQPARPKSVGLSTASRSENRERGSTATTRKRSRPTSFKRRSLSDDEDKGDGDYDSNRWPMLPPPKGGDQGPLKLESPIGDGAGLEICANINSYLFDYQRVGAQFLYDAYAKRVGAILGDEMGLGETIQVISLLSAILRKHGDYRDKEAWKQVRKDRRERGEDGHVKGLSGSSHPNPILIVVPASLLHNWESELRVWMCVQTVILIGKPEEREQIIEQARKGDYEIVICSYDVLKITLEKLKRVPWEVIVFDEMHCLKNPESQLTQAVKAIKCPRKLGLTGTLMQNNEKELHCLIDTIAPGVLGSWQEFRSF